MSQSQTDALIGNVFADVTAALRESWAFQFGRVRSLVESPIEEVFLATIVAVSGLVPESACVIALASEYDAIVAEAKPGTYVLPQFAVDGYRLDFLYLLIGADGASLLHFVVELDGHEFHERTKRQAQKDKKRDRHFTAKGWPVLRFTGSEVWANSVACVGEILSLLRSAAA